MGITLRSPFNGRNGSLKAGNQQPNLDHFSEPAIVGFAGDNKVPMEGLIPALLGSHFRVAQISRTNLLYLIVNELSSIMNDIPCQPNCT